MLDRSNGARPAALALALLLAAGAAVAADEFESPPAESPAAILPADLASGADHHVVDPVASDGLVRRYVVDSRFGRFDAYGRVALEGRVREVHALAELAKRSKAEVVAGGVGRGVAGQLQTAVGVVTHPVATVAGIPRGIAHLFHGYADEANEAVAGAKRATAPGRGGGEPPTAAQADQAVKRYADRYLGVTAAERRWYRDLGVDPYTDNAPLREAIHRDAKLEAGAGFGLKFVGLPAIPGIGIAARAEQAIYNEDPATVRARQRKRLAAYGLTPDEIARFENAPLLSPTRQVLLLEAAAALEGVEGRGELVRHALDLTSDAEAQVYLQSAGLLALAHREHPLAAVLPGVRLPVARRADGSLVVCGAFEAVYWTPDVESAERALRAALPEAAIRELWLDGTASAMTRAALSARGWALRESMAATGAR